MGSVVLADPEQAEREIAAAVLRRAGYETIEATSGLEALEAAQADGVCLVVLEVVLRGMTGYEVCRDLREAGHDDLAIFFLSSTHTDPVDRVAGLLFGADDFLVKPFDPQELIARVRRSVFRRPSARPVDGREQLRLTARERQVLNLLAEGWSQKVIAPELTISSKTVGAHIQNLLVKFGVHSRAELVASAYRAGFISTLDEPPRKAGNAGRARHRALAADPGRSTGAETAAYGDVGLFPRRVA